MDKENRQASSSFAPERRNNKQKSAGMQQPERIQTQMEFEEKSVVTDSSGESDDDAVEIPKGNDTYKEIMTTKEEEDDDNVEGEEQPYSDEEKVDQPTRANQHQSVVEAEVAEQKSRSPSPDLFPMTQQPPNCQYRKRSILKRSSIPAQKKWKGEGDESQQEGMVKKVPIVTLSATVPSRSAGLDLTAQSCETSPNCVVSPSSVLKKQREENVSASDSLTIDPYHIDTGDSAMLKEALCMWAVLIAENYRDQHRRLDPSIKEFLIGFGISAEGSSPRVMDLLRVLELKPENSIGYFLVGFFILNTIRNATGFKEIEKLMDVCKTNPRLAIYQKLIVAAVVMKIQNRKPEEVIGDSLLMRIPEPEIAKLQFVHCEKDVLVHHCQTVLCPSIASALKDLMCFGQQESFFYCEKVFLWSRITEEFLTCWSNGIAFDRNGTLMLVNRELRIGTTLYCQVRVLEDVLCPLHLHPEVVQQYARITNIERAPGSKVGIVEGVSFEDVKQFCSNFYLKRSNLSDFVACLTLQTFRIFQAVVGLNADAIVQEVISADSGILKTNQDLLGIIIKLKGKGLTPNRIMNMIITASPDKKRDWLKNLEEEDVKWLADSVPKDSNRDEMEVYQMAVCWAFAVLGKMCQEPLKQFDPDAVVNFRKISDSIVVARLPPAQLNSIIQHRFLPLSKLL